MAIVTVTPTVVHIRTIITMVMVTNAGPTALLPTGTSDQATITALTANPQALLIPATPPQLLESASSISLVWGTITVMLTSMVVPSTIAGGPYTNIRIRVEMTEYPPVSSRVRDRIARVCAKNILARASIPTCRVSTLSYHAVQSLETSHFILSIPADFPAPPPRTLTSKQQLGRTSHTQCRRHPPYRTARGLRSAYSPVLTASNDPTLPG
ncbi:hypothetical protein EDB89DRAFT_536859 [Lactarius sanguifluus]|nr:hypothetical protein EDB89DRAFT_536859 [Lactarius sanguifluus]